MISHTPVLMPDPRPSSPVETVALPKTLVIEDLVTELQAVSAAVAPAAAMAVAEAADILEALGAVVQADRTTGAVSRATRGALHAETARWSSLFWARETATGGDSKI